MFKIKDTTSVFEWLWLLMLMVLIPLTAILCVNHLFHTGIEYTFSNAFAAFVLIWLVE